MVGIYLLGQWTQDAVRQTSRELLHTLTGATACSLILPTQDHQTTMPKKRGAKKAGVATSNGPSGSFDDLLASFAAADHLAAAAAAQPPALPPANNTSASAPSSSASAPSSSAPDDDDYYGAGKTCACCGKQSASVQHCSRCVVTPYCNRECQSAHWKEHRVVCATLGLRRDKGQKVPADARSDAANALIAEEGIQVSIVLGENDTFSAQYGFVYSKAERGPFAATSVLVLGVHVSRIKETILHLNWMFTDPVNRSSGLIPGHTIVKPVDAPHNISQVSLLVSPTPAARAIIDHLYVCQTTPAFKRAGRASQVLVLVPLLHSESRAAQSKVPVARCPERTALHLRIAKELEEASLRAANLLARGLDDKAPPPPWDRVFESVASATWSPTKEGMLFIDERGMVAPPQPPSDPLHYIENIAARRLSEPDAALAVGELVSPREVVAGMKAELRTTLYGHFTRLGLTELPPKPTPASQQGWKDFLEVCTAVGLQGLNEAHLHCEGPQFAIGSQYSIVGRGVAIGFALRHFFNG